MESFKYPKQKMKKGRTVYGTLTSPPDHYYSGDPLERESILKYLQDTSKSFLWAILGCEKHESGKNHYHYVARYSQQVSSSVCDRMYEHFHDISKSKTDRILFATDNVKDTVGYTTKDGDYNVIGTLDINLEKIISDYKKKLSYKELVYSEGITQDKNILKEREIISWLSTYMKSKGYKVNYHTRQLVGVTKDQFFDELHEKRFSEMYGRAGLQLAEELIEKKIYRELPMWKPDLEWVSFSDGMWNIDEGIFYDNDSLEFLDKQITPVREYPFEFSDANPILFLALVERMGWDTETFRESYGRQFKTKSRRDKSLLIYGKPFSGKSTLVIPYLDVFRDTIGEWADDNGFAYSSIANDPKVFAEEVNIFDPSHNQNQMKKLLEGIRFKVQKKHANPVWCEPKTMIIVSNDSPPGDVNYHMMALKQRLDMYNANKPFDTADQEMMEKIKNESAQVLIWATRK